MDTGKVRQLRLRFSDLKFLDDNPRTITREDLGRLAGRIKEDPTFFDNRPCLVNFTDGQYLCYAGFQRAHAAAKVLKWKEVPCMIESDVPTDVMRKRAILDNTHDGKWDADVLSGWEFEMDELREMGVPEFVFGDGGKIEQMEDGDELELDQAIQLKPPREYVVIICNDSNDEWGELQKKLNLQPVRRGGYKKGSAFDSVGTQRVVTAEEFLKLIK